MEGSLSRVGPPPHHNSEIFHALVDGYTNTHTYTHNIIINGIKFYPTNYIGCITGGTNVNTD